MFKQVVIWVNVSLSLVLSAFRNSGDLRLRCYWGMAGMGLSLYRFSRVPGESWVVFLCLLGFGGCSNACGKSSGVLENFEPRFLWLVVCRFHSFSYNELFCLLLLLVVLSAFSLLCGLSSNKFLTAIYATLICGDVLVWLFLFNRIPGVLAWR